MYIDDFKKTESDIAVDFCHRCDEVGFQVRLEVKLPSKVHRSGEMRADALIFDLGEAICAVEFKSNRKHAPKPSSRQHQAYCGIGMPFFYCCGENEIEDTIENICALAEKLQDLN